MARGKAAKVPTDAHAREVAAEWVPVGDLLPWDRNPRRNDIAAGKVAESIRRFGFTSPIIARRENGEVIAGHTRLKAAKMLGLDVVPVRYLDLDPADAHLLALADNKLGEVAEWDAPQLADILSDFGLEDAEFAGWDSVELEKLANESVSGFSVDDGEPKFPGTEPATNQLTVYFSPEQRAVVDDAIAMALNHVDSEDGAHANGTAIWYICRQWASERG